jgi:hypothetical protein
VRVKSPKDDVQFEYWDPDERLPRDHLEAENIENSPNNYPEILVKSLGDYVNRPEQMDFVNSTDETISLYRADTKSYLSSCQSGEYLSDPERTSPFYFYGEEDNARTFADINLDQDANQVIIQATVPFSNLKSSQRNPEENLRAGEVALEELENQSSKWTARKIPTTWLTIYDING